MDDRELVARARRGEREAFADLVHRHTDTVWRFARPLVDDDATAEEIVQDTFLRAFRGLEGFRLEASVTTWLHTICHRVAIDRHRRRRLHVGPLEEAAGRPAPGGGATTDSVDDHLALERALAHLSEDERAAFGLVAVLGYRHDEAAEILGVPASTVRTRYGRARSRLATALQQDEEEGAR